MAELFVFGLVFGCIIALGAIGLSLVYGILRFANFAHGELMTWGAYIALFLISGPFAWLGIPDLPFAGVSIGWRMVLAFPLALALVGLIAQVSDRLVYRPLRRRNSNAVILAMAGLGLSFILRMSVSLLWGADYRFFRPGVLRPALQLPLGIKIRPDQILIIGLALVLFTALHLFLRHSTLGKAMRATADNRDLAQVAGIDTDAVIRLTWLIGGGLAAAGGILYGIDVQLNPGLGWNFLIPLFAATILGTIGNVYGALIGGLVIGVAQQMSTAVLLPTYKPVVAFAVMILILILRPRGIFGRRGL